MLLAQATSSANGCLRGRPQNRGEGGQRDASWYRNSCEPKCRQTNPRSPTGSWDATSNLKLPKGDKVAHILAVGHETSHRSETFARPFQRPDRNRRIRGYIFDMESYIRDCGDKYCGILSIQKGRLRHAHTHHSWTSPKTHYAGLTKD